MSAYYNEIDRYPAAWLRNLAAAGHIAAGSIDDRDIREVQPHDLRDYTQAHFFAGIGGWAYALRLAGWPADRPVWTGSCPCQPFSSAGKRGGTDDPRHLWPEWFRLIRECRPPVVFGEQVASKAGLAWLDLVCDDLEGAGYAVAAVDLCAASVGAPHRRQRLYFVACAQHPRWRTEHGTDGQAHRGNGPGWSGNVGTLADADGRDTGTEGVQRSGQHGLEPENGGIGSNLGDAGGAGLPLCQCGELPGTDRDHEGGTAKQSGSASGTLGDTERQGPQGCIGVGRANRPTAAGPWANVEWLACRDGKARPTEPGLFPLAYGVPGRVGRLRAYGNAIVPALAAEFIASYMETVAGRRLLELDDRAVSR